MSEGPSAVREGSAPLASRDSQSLPEAAPLPAQPAAGVNSNVPTLSNAEDAKPADTPEVDDAAEERAAAQFISSWSESYRKLVGNAGVLVPGLAVVVAGLGVVVTEAHYGPLGVPLGSLPVILLSAAGLGFLVFTGLLIYVGMAIGFGESVRRKFELLILANSAVGLFLLFAFVEPAWTVFAYAALILGGGVYWSHRLKQRVVALRAGGGRTQLHWEFSDLNYFIMPLLWAGLYGTFVYPHVSSRFGGGRPRAVSVVLSDVASPLVTESDQLEVFRTNDFLYLASLEKRESAWWEGMMGGLRGRKFVAIPLSQVRLIRYLGGSPLVPVGEGMRVVDAGAAISEETRLLDAGVENFLETRDAGAGVE